MAKIKHNNFIDTVDAVLTGAKKEEVLHLYAENKVLSGRTIQIKGKEMYHFGTTGYLGLEQDNRLKEAAVQAIRDFGTQFPLSKSYISHPLYYELESKVEQMYGIPPIITKNSTLGHLSVIPTLIRDEDAVIIDHQVHWSVQNACQLLKLRGIPVEMIRHNNMNMLEETITRLASKCKKIWYMADGVYSMFGDYAPIQDLLELTKKINQLHLYFDDVHGMSWVGKNGTGFVFDQIKELPDNIVVVGTLSKTFGASGATFFCKDQKLRDKIKNFGGPLTFSAQLEPASVAAAIASANIHLSDEIVQKQNDLKYKIQYFNELLFNKNLPIISKNNSPVFYLGLSTPKTAYNCIQRLYKDGFFLNLGIYRAVSIKNTGIRLTLSAHNEQDDIKQLAEAIEFHFPKALEETDNNINKIQIAFGLKQEKLKNSIKNEIYSNDDIVIEEYLTINDIPKAVWNKYMGESNITDYDGLKFLEQTFANTKDVFNKWDFYYYLIKDNRGEVIALTFFTNGIWKDDMLATESVSLQLEEIRKQNPLYLTSKVFSMGCLFTEGNHLFIQDNHILAEKAIKKLIEKIDEKQIQLKVDMVVLRDFENKCPWSKIIQDEGYIQIDMPESCVIKDNYWSSIDDFKKALTQRSRKHFNKEVEPYEKHFNVVVKKELNDSDLNRVYDLYSNVKDRNYAINTFKYNLDVFKTMNKNENWEFILLTLKNDEKNSIVGVMFCYKNQKNRYVPELIGMDYAIAKEYQLYRQLLFQTIKRANELKITNIDFGVSASFEKKKLGATIIPKVAFIQTNDNYKMELMNTMQNDFKK